MVNVFSSGNRQHKTIGSSTLSLWRQLRFLSIQFS